MHLDGWYLQLVKMKNSSRLVCGADFKFSSVVGRAYREEGQKIGLIEALVIPFPPLESKSGSKSGSVEGN